MVSKLRAARVAESIQRELAELLLWEVTDPRLRGISITDVRVDRELAVANVYVSALEGMERKNDILAGLQHAQGFLRSQLAQRVDLRHFPQLRFNWDPTPEKAARIEELLASLHDQDNEADIEPDE
jgi:ribosome-binding factor A